MPTALLLGCGRDHRRKVQLPGQSQDFSDADLTLCDMDPNCGAHVVCNLDVRPLPFADEQFDELHAYDVLEHLGRQGDWKGYFDEFAEYWRILKLGGTFHILVPIGADAFADPGHTRFFGINHFLFLSQSEYDTPAGKHKTDYRWHWKRDFNVLLIEQYGNHHLAVILSKA